MPPLVKIIKKIFKPTSTNGGEDAWLRDRDAYERNKERITQKNNEKFIRDIQKYKKKYEEEQKRKKKENKSTCACKK